MLRLNEQYLQQSFKANINIFSPEKRVSKVKDYLADFSLN